MGKHVPKLEIKPYKSSEGKALDNLTMDDYGIYLDGMEIRGLRSLSVHLDDNDLNIVSMDFAAELELDIEGLIEIDAQAKRVKDAKTAETIWKEHIDKHTEMIHKSAFEGRDAEMEH
jgi:hypothetical protein